MILYACREMGIKEQLVEGINTPCLKAAFLEIDRRDFLPEEKRRLAYDEEFIGTPITIFQGITTTALNLGLMMVDLLELKEGHRVLEVGTGSGYYTALISRCVGDRGSVFSLEIDRRAVELAKRVLASFTNVSVIEGDGSVGYIEGAPYDSAVIWAASPTLPCIVYEQLKEGGIIVVPIEEVSGRQWLYRVIKTSSGEPKMERITEVMFMKMRGKCGFIGTS